MSARTSLTDQLRQSVAHELSQGEATPEAVIAMGYDQHADYILLLHRGMDPIPAARAVAEKYANMDRRSVEAKASHVSRRWFLGGGND